jgi:hypothetical protein
MFPSFKRVDATLPVSPKTKKCDPDSTENTIIHAGDDRTDLALLAAANPNDGYLSWTTTDSSKYENSVYVPSTANVCKGLGFHWTITPENVGHIHIAAAFHIEEVEGWGAIGFSETGGMRGADVVYFTYSNSKATLVDAHILDLLAKPIMDEQQDWTLLNYTVTDDGYLIFEISRALDSVDSYDRPFVDDSSTFVEDPKLIAAWGGWGAGSSTSHGISYHGNNRLRTSIQLFDSDDGDVSPGLDYDSFLKEMQERSDSSVDLGISSLSIPMVETYYHEECLSTSDLISKGLFSDADSIAKIIGYEFLIDPAALKYMHHIVFYGHYTSGYECSPTYRSPVFAWTPGEEYLYFPQGAGFKLGGSDGFRSFTIQYHIDNKDLDANKVDNGSGIRLYTSNTSINIEIGMMQIGDPFLRLSGQKIGDGLTRHVLECPSTCTENNFKDEEITVVKENLHMHSYGKRIVNQVMRYEDVIHEGFIDYWDFDQSGSPAPQQKPYKVRRGDKFRTKCYYDANPTTVFGAGSSDEMCMAFILYYPKQSVETCGIDHIEASCRTNYIEKKELENIAQIGRVFGTSSSSKTSCSQYTQVNLGSSLKLRYKSDNATLTVELQSDRMAWLGFGMNSNGLMLDSDAIIGSTSGVAKYRIENTKDRSGVNKMADERQNVVGSFSQDTQGSTMIFTMLLDDGTSLAIPPEGEFIFIYALGRDNFLSSGHIDSGNIKLRLNPCSSSIGVNSSDKHEKIIALHGFIAAIVFGALVPVAILSRRLKTCLDCKLHGDKEAWFIVHSGLNTLSYILVIILLILVIYAKDGKKSQHFQYSHEIIGLVLFIIMTIQIVTGVLRPKTTHTKVFDSEIGLEEETVVDKSTSRREGWKRMHIILGIITTVLGIYQIVSGLIRYHEIYGHSIIDSL